MRGATSTATIPVQIEQKFQSTLLMRGATKIDAAMHHGRLISIHAPHARSDPAAQAPDNVGTKFQSTLLMRGATRNQDGMKMPVNISIHAPHARSDPLHMEQLHDTTHISIHAPHARSDFRCGRAPAAFCISIHAPHARSD